MALNYKNPISASLLNDAQSVERQKTFGTDYSVLGVGGYMEVYTLNDLLFTIPTGQTGTIEYTGNTIPIRYSVSPSFGVPNSITLNSDNISSGRRRLGMLVYVHETKLTYQFIIDDYETLWDNTLGNRQESLFGTVITDNTTGGTAFINAWLDNTIEGVSGNTRDNSVWKIFHGTDTYITGGTYFSGTSTLELYDNSGQTISVTGITAGSGGGGGTSGSSGSSGTTPPVDPLIEITITGTQNGVNKVFTLSSPLSIGTEHLFYLNGQLLTYTEDYTISGTTLTISTDRPAPKNYEKLRLFGSTGFVPVNGSSGSSGQDGSGTSGTSGQDGSGTSGSSGQNGSSGSSGVDGNGTSGTSGADGNGTSGTSGADGNGSSGTSGADGNGSSGTSGINGVTQKTLTFVVGDTTPITTGEKVKTRIIIPYGGTITRWSIMSDVSTSCVIDIWKSTTIPTNSDSITASAKPTLTAETFAFSSTLTGWTTSVSANDIFVIEVESNNNATYLNLMLTIE